MFCFLFIDGDGRGSTLFRFLGIQVSASSCELTDFIGWDVGPICSLFVDLFSKVDYLKSELSISSYCIALTTLEDVFLQLGEFKWIRWKFAEYWYNAC